ncbi:HGL314Cp [Eremothecium sinecaudum]|uniref:HGL314Cp n=1 Tax=Eremothecium sinecaudum TaxID=45286 RepID=A0A0X8HV08_9SACH|nr:HGL314Cp [Eremothecium sinecaudum]AMD22026.1 HGL314Cp [Eremothecium sinecaudum]
MLAIGDLTSQLRKCLLSILVIFVFFEGCLTIIAYQMFVNAIWPAHTPERQKHLDRTKKSFIILLVTILATVAPSNIRICTDNNTIAKGTFRKDAKLGRIVSSLKQNSIIISNHQLYTDWVFLWWLTYTSGLAGSVIIMLKKSLESLPILGYGMKNYGFIFMNRKWYLDKTNLSDSLTGLDMNARGIGKLAGNFPTRAEDGTERYRVKKYKEGQIRWPYSLILFPEGTNMSPSTREKTKQYAAKVNCKPPKHVLLPHVTGLRFALQKLEGSCDCVYDVTVGYSGVTRDTYGEKIYQLNDVILKGKAPKIVDMYIRSFSLSDIPYNNEKEFDNWVHRVWEEKDLLMETYYEHGCFNLDPELNHTVMGKCEAARNEVIALLIIPVLASFLTLMALTKLALFYFAN